MTSEIGYLAGGEQASNALPMIPRLAATDLACRRGDRLLFRGLNLQLGAGDLCHVTGVNGIGKSSLLRVLAGLLSPYAGDVEREGDIGLMDERPALDPDRPLGRALGFWNALDGGTDCTATYSAMGLTDLLDIPVRYLSTGQRKRAAMAALISRQVTVWLLDEPLNGLDRQAQAKVMELITQHGENGGICLIASHQDLPLDGLKTLALEDFVP